MMDKWSRSYALNIMNNLLYVILGMFVISMKRMNEWLGLAFMLLVILFLSVRALGAANKEEREHGSV
jgi:Ca2+/Na+ antiporter